MDAVAVTAWWAAPPFGGLTPVWRGIASRGWHVIRLKGMREKKRCTFDERSDPIRPAKNRIPENPARLSLVLDEINVCAVCWRQEFGRFAVDSQHDGRAVRTDRS